MGFNSGFKGLIFFLCLLTCFVCLSSILCILSFCIVLRIVSLLYIAVSFLILYKFTEQCQRLETQLQSINIIQARCHGDILRAGKSRWQVGYRVILYCHQGWKSVYLPVTFGQCGENDIDEVIIFFRRTSTFLTATFLFIVRPSVSTLHYRV